MIGAGSIVFGTTLLNDLFQTRCLSRSSIALMGPTLSKLQRVEQYAQKIIDKNKLQFKVSSTTNRREALKGADYVLALFQVGGIEGYKKDYEIPMKYGVDQCIGQCVGPGGVLRALRINPGHELTSCGTWQRSVPNAVMLNYVNPMAAISIAMGKTSKVSFVGLCPACKPPWT